MRKYSFLLLIPILVLPLLGANSKKIIPKNPSLFSKLLSHIALSGKIAGTWDATNEASLFVKRDEKVLYTGTNPSREFDTTEGWASNYTSFSSFLGVKFSWIAIGGEYETFKMQPKEERFTMENTRYGIAVSLPTVDMKGTILSARAEIRIAPNGPISPYFAVSYPVSCILKSLTYNSAPEPVEVKNEAWTIYGVKVTPYENTEISANSSPAFELGYGIRIKGAFRLRFSAKYRRLDWNLFYHKHRDEIILFGASLAI